ncbi:MAG: hypothetical protein OSA98_16140 [Rubripirellula sp.]|nr:hypothetical protein [Rubripirellula sp.]
MTLDPGFFGTESPLVEQSQGGKTERTMETHAEMGRLVNQRVTV